MATALSLIFLIVIHGVNSLYGWYVSYRLPNICALKGSSVIMPCTYQYPAGHQIEKAFWTKTDGEFPDLSDDSEYSQRVQYLGDKQQICTLRLRDVTQKDSHMYYFRFITDKPEGKWMGKPGVTLNITDLQVETPERVKEGDSVTLRCKTTCTLTDTPTFIWFRNTQPLTERTDRNNELLLQSVRREDAGSYSCAVQGQNLTSPAVTLNVTYSPSNVTISIHPSGDIVEGDSVTLTCSSDADPPGEISWFKDTTFLNHGETYSISWISSDHSGEYKCKAKNEHGEKYSSVTLNVMYSPRNILIFVSPPNNIMENSSVTLTCSSDANPPAEISWFKGTTFLNHGEIYSISRIGSDHREYKCKAQNKHGQTYSGPVILDVTYAPKNMSVSFSGPAQIWKGDAVNLTCSSDSNPPAHSYTWFKENEASPVGSGQRFSALQSGWFYCVAQNEYGSQRSAAVSVTEHHTDWPVVFGITVGCVSLFIIIMIFITLFMMKNRKKRGVDDPTDKQDDLYSTVTQGVSIPNTFDAESTECVDYQYASVAPSRFREDQTESRDTEKIQYATVQHHRNKERRRSEENETQYDNIRVYQQDAAMRRSNTETVEDTSVIYSSVK